jgi:D-alanyl-D-alanine dipeptidase
VQAESRPLLKNYLVAIVLLGACFTCASLAQSPNGLLPGPRPADVSLHLKSVIGEYGSDEMSYTVFEQDRTLWIASKSFAPKLLKETSPDLYWAILGPNWSAGVNGTNRRLTVRNFDVGLVFPYRSFGVDEMQVARVSPVRPMEILRAEALAAFPPKETGSFRKRDLVEVAPLDATVHLDIRYATANDFLGTPVYSQARAFLQRPAADALLRIQTKLKPLGFGLLIHDAYRPWYVTKIFWDATPPEGKIFVADPAQGSRHNRGCAVDLTLYDLATGNAIEMTGTYDEMSPRSFPDYPGGTSLQRWHRDLLRRAMESEGFTVYESEWWHFDYKDWREYPILNIPFEKLDSGFVATPVH